MSENKKLAGLKAVLVRAWRERWTDTQWSIHSKRFITETPSDCALLAGNLLLGYFQNVESFSPILKSLFTQDYDS